MTLCALICSLASCTGEGTRQNTAGDEAAGFRAGFARVDISPDHPVKMGGYGMFFLSEDFCRWSDGVHDPVYATAVAVEPPLGEPVILIHLDTLGAIVTDVVPIQEGVAAQLSVAPERVIVAASHSHGSPDTVGIWGVVLPPVTGRDDAFIERMIQGAVQAGTEAFQAREPASLRVATGTEARMHFNPQLDIDPEAVTDDVMTVMGAYDLQGRLIGSLMNWGCHPMVMGPQNTKITSDYPGAYYRIMEEDLGGIHMYLNSSLGATVHPQNPDHPFEIIGDEWGTWEDVERFGRVLAEDVKDLLAVAEPVPCCDLELVAKTVYGKLENPFFSLVSWLDLIPREMPPLGGEGESAVIAFSIGDVRFCTVPGELSPNIGLAARDIMGGSHGFLITLGMDWVGYIMTEEQYRNLLYIYFSVLSVGPTVGDTVLENFHNLFDAWPG